MWVLNWNNTLKEMMAAALGHYTCAIRNGKAFQEDVL